VADRPPSSEREEGVPAFRLEFYEDAQGHSPVYRWMRDELTRVERSALGMVMRRYLQEMGADVVTTRFGRALGKSLYELRLDDSAHEILARLVFKPRGKMTAVLSRVLLLRVFFTVHGDKVVLLLGGYDKGRHTAKSYQQEQIKLARARLKEWRQRHGA
jgi:hypothetical protein